MASHSLLVLSMILVLHSIISMASASLSCVLQCESEVNLHLYLHQIASGPGTNQVVIVTSSKASDFGLTSVTDWAVIDGPNPATATIVARTKGMQVQADVAGPGWFNYFSMVFEKNSRYNGSSFEAMGINFQTGQGQMAIMGGTGEFAMARGIIKYNALPNPPTFQTIKELNIRAFYVKPADTTSGGAIQ
ncbi:dirigent protein 4-like [Hordeum vulgare subsp. vulgare]|uniref:Dirigent protein n=1 Tax=Hordeum vulgare subsp. vulgare TaxID=112509 RepID=A0A8I6WPE0_HORVV|nr:dirigent protein 4-like [Hordeum vulgare subsp. vulgare]